MPSDVDPPVMTVKHERLLAKERVAAQRASEALTRAAAAYAQWGDPKAKAKTIRRMHAAAGAAQKHADGCRAYEARLRAEREER